jgi:hypothetical protein
VVCRVGKGRHAVVVHRHRVAVGEGPTDDAESPVLEAVRQCEDRERRQRCAAARHDVLGVPRGNWRQRPVAAPMQVSSALRQGRARPQTAEGGEAQHGAAGGECRTPEEDTSRQELSCFGFCHASSPLGSRAQKWDPGIGSCPTLWRSASTAANVAGSNGRGTHYRLPAAHVQAQLTEAVVVRLALIEKGFKDAGASSSAFEAPEQWEE